MRRFVFNKNTVPFRGGLIRSRNAIRVKRRVRASREDRRRELEAKMSELVKEKAVLEDEELSELWTEMMEVVKSDDSAKESEDMISFMTKLFTKLSRKRTRLSFVNESLEYVF